MITMFTPFAKHHHFIGNNFNAIVFTAFFVFPAAGLQSSFNVDLLTLGEILFADLCQVTPGNYIEPFGLVMTFAIQGVPLTADRHCKSRNRFA